MFYVVPVATDDEDYDKYGAPRHIKYVVLQVAVSSNLCTTRSCVLGYYGKYPISRLYSLWRLSTRSGRISIFGWTMMYNKWGHPVATFPTDEGDNTSLYSQDER
eukprot:6213066-Pleurochrysis_carterae.AAC.4